MNAISAFSGVGLLDLGLSLAGIGHIWFCEADEWRRERLAQRFPGVPIFDDIRAVDGSAPCGDLFVGGFPCRGASSAGDKAGMDNPETALWREMARIIRELRPRLVLLENVANLLAVQGGAAWGEVCGDLASLRYVFAWDCLPAAAFGAPHLRDRVFLIAANTDASGWQEGTEWSEARPCSGEGKDRQAVAGGVAPNTSKRPEGCDTTHSERGLATQLRGGASADPCIAGWQERDSSEPSDSQFAAADSCASANPDSDSLRQQSEPERGSSGTTEFGIAPADLHHSELQARRHRSGGDRLQAHLGGDPPEWGAYSGAIARWEEVTGPAPEPLLRGVDARGTRRVVRSRLSALGDGVLVQIGYYLGRRIIQFDRGKL